MTISINNLRKTYGNVVAVKDLSVDIAEGEMVVLLGPSGCGKTTTMRCVAGLETPDAGKISIDGQSVFDGATGIDVPVNRRDVGMVFQSYAIWPHMTVYQNVAFPLEMEGVGAAETKRRVAETLEQVGLRDYAERGASALSGGQMQRVALARSLVMRPAVLLFDEPLSNLDARLRDRLRIQLREIQTQLKITGIYVTHDQQEALALADRIVVMESGEIEQIGDPISIYNKPRNSAIAAFLGYSNIFDVSQSGEHEVVLASGAKLSVEALVASRSAKVCVRPDDIAITTGHASGNASNDLHGTVTLASFMGSHMLFRVRLADGAIWEIWSKAILSDVRAGAEVTLNIPPSAIRVLPE